MDRHPIQDVLLSSETCKVSLIPHDLVGIYYTVDFKYMQLYLQKNLWYYKILVTRVVSPL